MSTVFITEKAKGVCITYYFQRIKKTEYLKIMSRSLIFLLCCHCGLHDVKNRDCNIMKE